MICASWSRSRRRSRQESLGSPARKKKVGPDQAWGTESARPMRRTTRKKTANRSGRALLGAACERLGRVTGQLQWSGSWRAV